MKWKNPVNVTEAEKNRSAVEWKLILKRNVTAAAIAGAFIATAAMILIVAFAMMAV